MAYDRHNAESKEVMESEDSIETFQAITGADRSTAEHVLEAHGWDLNRSVDFFMESGVSTASRPITGHTGHNVAAQDGDVVEVGDSEPSTELSADPPGEAAQTRFREPLLPSSGLRDAGEGDDDLQAALTASLRTEDDEPEEKAAFWGMSSSRGAVSGNGRLGESEPGQELPSHGIEDPDEQDYRGMRFGTVEPANGDFRQRPRSRRAAAAASAAATAAALANEADDFSPLESAARLEPALFPGAFPGFQPLPPHSSEAYEGGGPAANGNGHLDLPGVNMEEARMLEAAMMGIPYEGRIPDFRGPDAAAEPVSPSVLRQRELREEQDQAYQESLQADQRKADALEGARQAREAEQEREARAREGAEQAARDHERDIDEKRAALPEEPAAGEPGSVTILVRLPDGKRLSRRFLRSCEFASLFDFADVSAAPSIRPGAYRLVTQFPRRVFEAGREGSLEEAGLTQKQEALLLELL